MFAVLSGDVIVEMFSTKPVLHASIQIVDTSGVPGVAVGWTYDGGVFSPPSPPAPPSRSVLTAYANTKQSMLAASGVNVDVGVSGSPEIVFADTNAQGLSNISGALQFVQINPSATINWTGATGSIALNATQVLALATGAFIFVQATYTTLGTVLANITAGTVTTIAQIDAAAWPTNHS